MQRLDVSRWARRYNRRPTTLDSLFHLAFALVLAALALALTYSHHTISCILGRMRPPITPDGSPPSFPFHSCSPTTVLFSLDVPAYIHTHISMMSPSDSTHVQVIVESASRMVCFCVMFLLLQLIVYMLLLPCNHYVPRSKSLYVVKT